MSKELEGLIEAYVKVRDGIKEIKERHKQELAPWEQGLAEAEGALMTLLNTYGAESMRTNAGTAFKAQWTKATVTDWQAVLDWAVANERWDLFERRVAKSVVEEIGAVPGVEIERGVRVNVRRS